MKYYTYRDMTLNGCDFSHIVHFYKHVLKLNLVSFQDWPNWSDWE